MNNYARIASIVLTLAVIGGIILYIEMIKPMRGDLGNDKIELKIMNKAEKAKLYPKAEELQKIAGYVNVDKITVGELLDKKIILVDFWTYSCINCQRTTPYLNAWYQKYKDKGLEIIGVHTPEFAFEKEYANVAAAVKKFGIKYPVALDNDYGTWLAYNNRYWPRKYLIDIDGYIIYDHIGEGGYEETENKIRELLEERIQALEIKEKIDSEMVKPEGLQEIDFQKVRSPEIYFGAARNLYLGNGQSQKSGTQTLTEPAGLKTNILYLVGEWNFEEEYTENKNAGAKIIFRYDAKNVYLVASASKLVRVKVLQDGQELKTVIVKEDGLYSIIENDEYGEHTLELIIEAPNLRAFAFTFG